MAGYSGTPLPTKLGIRTGHRVLVQGAPADLELGPLPDHVTLHTRPTSPPYDVGLVFCADLASLERRWGRAHEAVRPEGRLWVAWPKKQPKQSSNVPTDLTEGLVRGHGLSHGRVDVKVCAVDATWSGLAFVVRVADR